jgi:hypothetical protein
MPGGRWTWALHNTGDRQTVCGRCHPSRAEALVAIELMQGAPANGCRFTTHHDPARRVWSWRVVTRNGWLVAHGSVADDRTLADRVLHMLAGTTRATPVLLDEVADSLS